MMGVSSICSCRGMFKKIYILPVPCEYIFSSMVFIVNNLDNFQTYSIVYRMNTMAKHQLHRPTVNLSCTPKGVFYYSIKIFNSLPTCILKLKHKKPKFKVAQREYFIAHTFYSLEDFHLTVKSPSLFNINVTTTNNKW
jgi:hypothetical protein